jgi:hypothetical protein
MYKTIKEQHNGIIGKSLPAYKTIQQYARAGFVGMDVSLPVSLFEKGFAFLERDKDYVFVNRANVGVFCEDILEKGKDIKEVLSWATDEDWEYVLKTF